MKNLFDVSGKVAVITGGSRGIGAMIARGFVENGVKTYITARKQVELEATAAELSKLGECIAIASDLSTLEGVTAFADEIKSREDKVDILVNNAGATWGAQIDEFPEAGWDKVMDLNVKSLFFLTQQLLPAMRNAGDAEDPARVINIASVNGFFYPGPGMNTYSYSSSKAAVVHLTKHLSADLVKDHINVNGIAPGFFPSKMTAFALENHEAEVAAANPRGRIGSPEDAAGTAIYLSSRASAWVIGETIILDGGQCATAH